MKKNKNKKIVVMGGGTGSFTVLSGLKKYDDVELTAIVSMADDGGSTGILRDEYGVLPPGDIRQCLVALSETSDLMRELFNFRFSEGGLKGHNFGNLFISAIEKITGDFNKSLDMISEVLKVRGLVIPVTLDKVRLVAELKNGKKLYGEGDISDYQMISRFGVKKIYFDKKAKANPKAIKAIKEADLIVVGPGSFYSSLIPNFLVDGVSRAVISSKAKKVFVCNIMNKYGHTDNFTVQDFVDRMEKFIKPKVFDFVIYNNTIPLKALLKKYIDEGEPVLFDKARKISGRKFIGADLLSKTNPKKQKGDILKNRALIRHDQNKLAEIIMKI
ncbi:YvcK family protein [Candidatus Azambacteria bacterium]|nr:YvcK family protein [Candidatus Azambacteria bacterium]